MTSLVCIGVPYFIGERIERRNEVSAIRDSGIAREIGADWVKVTPHRNESDPISAVNCALAEAVAAHRDALPIVFASDCMSALGTVKGLEREVAVVWYDAHGDFNTPDTSPSGFLGGMPLAMLVGRGDLRYMQAIGLDPVAESDVLITDARDLDPGEAIALAESTVTHLTRVEDLLTVDLPDKPLYVHLDIDVVRIEDMPATNYPAAGGPTLDTVAATVERIARDANVVALLLSLWNDELSRDRRSLECALRLVRAFTAGLRAKE